MTNYLKNKKVLIGITGGIAAYKVLELIRRLTEQGAQVRTILTENAKQFVTPLSVHALSGEPVCDSAMEHIELARWADVLLIAPATANFIAKAAHGLADDLLTNVYLATTAPVLIAPAMNQQMWQHKGTQDNLEILRQRAIKIVGPASGSQACGENGPGRMLEAMDLLDALNAHFIPTLLTGKHLLITAGPTHEHLDPIRFLSNHSSGKMGYALADAALELGAKVTLISGPTNLTPKSQINYISIISAADMHKAVLDTIETQQVDIFIACAAVADYRPKTISDQKIKKTTTTLMLELEITPDILATVAKLPNRPYTVGFAAETQDLLQNATHKLKSKDLDLIFANAVNNDQVFGQDKNEVVIIRKNGEITALPRQRKEALAYHLLAAVVAHA